VATSAGLLVAPSAFIVYDAFTTMGHGLQSLMALTSRRDNAKKCQFDLSLLSHSFSQHGHLYLGWCLPFDNVDCIFNNSSILKTFCALSFRVYRNKNHVNNNIVLPFSFLHTSCHHCNILGSCGGGVNF
jgi:hypothetical protein